MSNNEPPVKVRDGLLEVVGFENKTENGSFLSFQHSRSYKDGEEWKKTQSLSGTQPLQIAKMYETAYERGREYMQAQKQERSADKLAHEPDLEAAKEKAEAHAQANGQDQEQDQGQGL